MSDGITLYEHEAFGALRTYTEEDGAVLFCASDVAKALGYANPRKAISDHCKGVTKRYPLETPGGIQQSVFITEANVLRLIVSSKLPAAQAYEAWVFEEVLPAVHKHGGYLTDEKLAEALSDPDTIIRLATDLKAERERCKALQAENDSMAPKALFADAVSASDTCILIGALAKLLRQNGVQMGQNRLFAWMRENGYLMSREGQDYNLPTQASMDKGLFRVKERTIANPDGSTRITRTTVVTGKGQQHFVDLFLEGGEGR